MKKFKITYTQDTVHMFDVVIEAVSYTMALLAFVIKFPTYIYAAMEEIL